MADKNYTTLETGETNLKELLKSMKPRLNEGEYVFCTLSEDFKEDLPKVICTFNEQEGLSIILKKEEADNLNLNYHSILSWITLTIHSSLDAIGLTAAFSMALSNAGISCNVVAAFFHDHIFIAKKDTVHAMNVLDSLSKKYQFV